MAVVALALALALVLALAQLGSAQLHTSLYRPLAYNTPCWALLDDAHDAGCRSPEGGHDGVITAVHSVDDVLALSRERRWTVLLEDDVLSRELLDSLLDTPVISSIIVFRSNGSQAFSPASTSPNAKKGLYYNQPEKQHLWNPHVCTGEENDCDFIIQANRTGGAILLHRAVDKGDITLRANTFMHGAKDADTCLRRGYCDPLGNWNVFATLRPITNSDRIVLASAALDSSSLFKDQAPGAAGTVAAFVTLLLAAEALGQPQIVSEMTKNILFAFFNGESYDYIGSSRFSMDLVQGRFPYWVNGNFTIGPDRIDSMIDISQVGSRAMDPTKPRQFYIHRDPDENALIDTENLAELVLNEMQSSNITAHLSSNPHLLPPSSTHSLLRWGRRSISAITVADHDSDVYNNRYFQSFLDNAKNANIEDPSMVNSICSLASSVARSLYKAAGGSGSVTRIQANCDHAKSLIHSVAVDINSTFSRELFNGTDCLRNGALDRGGPLSLYVGVFNHQGPPCLSSAYFSVLYLAQVLPGRQRVDVTHSNACKNQNMVWTSGKCVEVSVFTAPALSPAFEFGKVVNSSFSTWTESRLVKWFPPEFNVLHTDTVQ